jgi:RNA-binding protein YhbY
VYFLGSYKSEKRATEVLSEIQSKITNLELVKIAIHDKDNSTFGYSEYDFIYEMPLE